MTEGDIVRVTERTRLDYDSHHDSVYRETWTDVEIQTEEPISKEMADELWHHFAVDVEEEGIEVQQPE